MRFVRISDTQKKFFKFALFGGVVFTWGILLNFLTVDVLHADKKIAYLFVISSQILICLLVLPLEMKCFPSGAIPTITSYLWA